MAALEDLGRSGLSGSLSVNREQQSNSGKTEWLWVLGPAEFMPCLVLDGIILPQTDPVHNLGSSWTYNSFSRSRGQSWLGGPLVVHWLCLFLDQEALLTVTLSLVTSRLDYCNVDSVGCPKVHRKLQLV